MKEVPLSGPKGLEDFSITFQTRNPKVLRHPKTKKSENPVDTFRFYNTSNFSQKPYPIFLNICNTLLISGIYSGF